MGSAAKSYGIIGWREWIALPALGVHAIKAKVDTGARSSALHAFDLEHFQHNDQAMVRFQAHPIQRDDRYIVMAEAVLLEERVVRNSGGQEELRPVIETSVQIGSQLWSIELTLTNRDEMGFRMLLGRQAVRRRYLVDPGHSYLQPLPEENLPYLHP
ncbi:MAG TPA: ATP-dependent zinc protease [Leptolyngbyaceae cyanobacterium M65_K2018_010]|nr:ATP-dependent zinc protease [Leptolyngbyaceae cyanobacterium M65_K2018_010]